MVHTPSATSTSIDIALAPWTAASAAQHVARDYHTHDLRGSFADALDPQLPVPALERHLARDAHAAEHLDAAIDHATCGFGPVDLGNRCVQLDVFAAIRFPRRIEDEHACGAQLDFRVDEQPLDRLPVGEPCAEC